MNNKKRKDDLSILVDGLDDKTKQLVLPLIENLIYVEERIDEVSELPFIIFQKENKANQKATPASKLYKELIAMQMQIIGQIQNLLGIENETGNDSPLMRYLDRRAEEMGD